MIVPVRRWATTALFGLSKPAEETRRHTGERKEKREAHESLLGSFERLLSVHADIVIRGLDD